MQENPLRDRIVKVFSQNEDGSMCFEDFLNMMSVFSEAAPNLVKCYYAFEIYGKLVSSLAHYTLTLVMSASNLVEVKIYLFSIN